MNNEFNYKSNDYDRQSQRFVIPLYIKDGLGNYKQSSTATLVRYNNVHHYAIFAAHALEGGIDIRNVFHFSSDGSCYQLIQHAIGYKVFEEDDIVLVDFFNQRFDLKNYFNLDIEEMPNGVSSNFFCWTGYPLSQSKKKDIHNTKSPESLIAEMVHNDESGSYITKIKYLTINSETVSFDNFCIKGFLARKGSVVSKNKGLLSKPPSLAGMSGGAMYFSNLEKKLSSTLDDTFFFAGIGVEHRVDGSIVGVSRYRILQLIKSFDESNPILFSLC